MAETIVNGSSGAAHGARVDAQGRLSTLSVTEPEDKWENRKGRMWSLYFTETPTGANDYFFYLKNTGETILAITDIRVMAAAADTLNYNFVSGTPTYSGASDVTPVARLLGSSGLPAATIKQDVDITNLTEEGTIFFERISSANVRYKLSTSSNILIPQGQAFGIKAVTGTALITMVVSLTELISFE
jgi:hypothetical protein